MAREVPEEESYRRADEESRIQKFNKINKENMAIIGIDFDGTCVTDLFPYVGDNIGAASVLRKLADKNLLILYTVRDGKYLQDAVDWFKYNHINLYSVNCNPEPVSSSPKLYCDYYIDDRNIGTPLTIIKIWQLYQACSKKFLYFRITPNLKFNIKPLGEIYSHILI